MAQVDDAMNTATSGYLNRPLRSRAEWREEVAGRIGSLTECGRHPCAILWLFDLLAQIDMEITKRNAAGLPC